MLIVKMWKHLHCRRHSFAHGLEESSVSWSQIFIIIIISLPSSSYCIIVIAIILCTLSSHHLSSFSCPYHLIHLTHTSYFSLFVILHFSLFIPSTIHIIHHSFILTSYFNLNVCWRHSTIICYLFFTFQPISTVTSIYPHPEIHPSQSIHPFIHLKHHGATFVFDVLLIRRLLSFLVNLSLIISYLNLLVCWQKKVHNIFSRLIFFSLLWTLE